MSSVFAKDSNDSDKVFVAALVKMLLSLKTTRAFPCTLCFCTTFVIHEIVSTSKRLVGLRCGNVSDKASISSKPRGSPAAR